MRAAPHYTDVSSPEPVRAGEASAGLEQAVHRAAAVANRPLEGDGRLAAIAEAALLYEGENGAVPARFVELHARQLGLADMGLHLVVLPGGPPQAVDDAMSQAVFLRASKRPVTHYGVAVVADRVALVLSRRAVSLSPTPRGIEVGQPIVLRGRVMQAQRGLHVAYRDPQRRRRQLPVADAGALHVRVPTQAPGRYVLEVVGAGGGQPEVLARMPIYVGVAPPREVTLRSPRSPEELAAQASELSRLLGEARMGAGVSAVSPLPSLTRVATSHAAALRDRALVGFGGSELPSPVQRVRRAGFGTGLVLHNVARGVDAADLHAQFMADKGLRNNALGADVTHVGIGVVEGVDDELVAAVVLVRLTGWIDVVEARTQLLASINAARRVRGVPPLQPDPDLAVVAQDNALRFFEPPFPDERQVVSRSNRELDALSIAYKRVAATMAVADGVAEIGALEPALEADATHVGIGLAQGDHPRAGARRLAAILTLGYRR